MHKTLSKLILVTLIVSSVFAACSKAPPPVVETPVVKTPVVEAPVVETPPPAVETPTSPGAGTVVEDQFKVLDDAKKVEQQGLDAEAKRRAEFDHN